MRYEIDENNYISAVYFNCYGSACAEYTGNIPDGYTSLEDWASNATIQAYKIVDSNLVYDSVRDEQLQAQWEEELQNNTPKEYELPTASATTLGGVKVGAGLAINEGVLSATGGGTADSIDWSNVQNKPTKVSQFTNDVDYQTASQVEATVTGKGYQTASDVNTIVNNEIKSKMPTALDFYPIGSIYMSVSNVNPSNLFGGTWERASQGRFLIGVGSPSSNTINDFGELNNNGYIFNSEDMGGQYNHTLTIEEMAKHSHVQNMGEGNTVAGSGDKHNNISVSGEYATGTKATAYQQITETVGENLQHNNTPPYYAVYIWKRTA